MAFDPTHDQIRVFTTLDHPLFVSAGAGSGKSSTLAERVAWAFRPESGADGHPFLDDIGQVLIITFTHAAAEEIKGKVRARLREAGLTDQALAVDGAWISTIHAMCARIIRRHAFELGVDPDFRMISAVAQDEMLEDAREQVLRQVADDRLFPELCSVVPMHGKGASDTFSIADMAKALISAAANSSRGLDSVVFSGEDVDPLDLLAAYRDLLGSWIELVSSDEKVMRGKLAPKDVVSLSEDRDRIDALLAASASPSDEELDDLFGSLAKPSRKYGTSDIRDLTEEVIGAQGELRVSHALGGLGTATDQLVAVSRMISDAYQARKAEEGVLDNDDLTTLGLAALRDHPDIAQEYRDRFKLVMVDEFQDTNAQQVELVELLSGEGACHLATVGDAQQSIYRFRGADVEVFRDREASMPSESVIQLDVNFRSHSDILAFVAHALGHGVLEGFMPLAPSSTRRDDNRARDLPRCTVELVQANKQGKACANSADRTRVLAARIARRLAAFREAGESPDDMVLLLGKMSNLDVYLQALRSVGLDCVVSGGSLFTKCEEVGVVAALLGFLANPHDTENGLFSVLTSEMFGIDADDLAALATKVQEKNGALAKRGIDVGLAGFDFVPGVEPSPKLLRAHEVLQRATERASSWRISDVLLAACRESGWLARLEAGDAAARGRLANVLAAIRYVGEIADEGELGLARSAQEFRHWLDVAKEGPASLSGVAGGAVRVMTVHASKGLEFPVVAVAECWDSRHEGTGLLTENIAGVTHAALVPRGIKSEKLSGLAPETADECVTRAQWAGYLCDRSAKGSDAEAARLLYVALTRAREALVLGMAFASTKKEPGAGRLMKAVIAALYPDGLPDVGASVSTFDYVYQTTGDDKERQEVRETHSAMTFRTDITPVELLAQTGASEQAFEVTGDDDIAGTYRDLSVLLASPESEDAPTFALFDPAPADGLAEVARQARPWQSRSDVFSYSSIRARMQEAAVPRTREQLPPEASIASLAGDDSAEGADVEPAPAAEDADRATDLGSAFHELAQAMVETGRALTPERIDATSRAWGLRLRQRERLERALGRWEASDIRAEALSHGVVQAEVPFFVPVSDSELGSYVEGFIDLLARDAGSDAALVVDYKTGDAGLSADELRANHEMQANFYAWVLMRQGMRSVECAFVCVERDDGCGQPEVVRYAFDERSRPTLA